jgi:hypothetical protein
MIDSMKLFADKSGAIKEEPAGRGKNNAKGRPKTEPVNYGDKSKSLTAVNSLLNDNDLAHSSKEKGGDSIFLLSVCPENAQHAKGKAHIKVAANGDTTAACQHNSCEWGYRSLHKKWTGEYPKDNNTNNGEKSEINPKNTAARIVNLMNEHCEFFLNTSRETFARIHTENGLILKVDSKVFRDYVSAICWKESQFVAAKESLNSAINIFEGTARSAGDERNVFLRIAEQDGVYFLDLCDTKNQVVRIDENGWELVSEPKVMFYRSQNMRPLPEPLAGGDYSKLWDFVNIPEAYQGVLTVLLLEWLRDNTTQPLLELIGEQGCGKSLMTKFIRKLIDPNRVPLRGISQKVEDTFILASNSHLQTIENASYLKNILQDALCSLSTGGGFAARKLYTDGDEAALDLRKPVLMNGIDVLVTRPDLLDRTIHINLPRLKHRVVESELEKNFEKSIPDILGGLLDLFSKALGVIPDINIAPQDLPRLGDFGILGEAVYKVQGKPEEKFLKEFSAMRKNAVLRILEATPLGSLIQDLVINEGEFTGNFKLLLAKLRKSDQNSKLPTSPKALADKLRRLAPALRESGFQIEFIEERKEDGFHVIISKSLETSTASTASTGNNDNSASNPALPELPVCNPKVSEKNNNGNAELF